VRTLRRRRLLPMMMRRDRAIIPRAASHRVCRPRRRRKWRVHEHSRKQAHPSPDNPSAICAQSVHVPIIYDVA
jgi:hypothetical protein